MIDGSTPSMPTTRAAPIASTSAYVQFSSAAGPMRSTTTRHVFRKQLTCLTTKPSRPVAAESFSVVSSEAATVWTRTSPGMISGRVRSGGGCGAHAPLAKTARNHLRISRRLGKTYSISPTDAPRKGHVGSSASPAFPQSCPQRARPRCLRRWFELGQSNYSLYVISASFGDRLSVRSTPSASSPAA